MADSANIIGKVAAVEGQAFAKSPDGVMRQIKLGDSVFEGEVIQAVPGGHVELVFRDGTAYFVRDNEAVTLDGMVFGGRAIEAANVIGKVASVEGQVFAKGASGAMRQLKVGDPVFEGEVVQTPAGGRVELAFNNGTAYFLRDKETVTLDGMVFGGRAMDAKEAALMPGKVGELDDIARAIAEGNSLDRLLEETAAGRAGVFGNLDDSHSFVQLLRIAEAIDPLGYQFGVRDGGGLGEVAGGDAAEGTGTGNQAVAVPANRAPVFSGVDSGAVTEDTATPTLSASGTLIVTDADQGQSAINIGAGITASVGALGSISISAVGAWTYSVANADVQYLGLGETKIETFTVKSVDGTAHSITVTINGSEDAPVLGGVVIGTVAEDGTQTAGGTLTISDVDTLDNPLSFADVASTAGTNGYGSFVLSGGAWTYTLDNAAVQFLDAGQSTTDSHTYTATDGSTRTVTVTINGAEDAPVLGGVVIGTVAEDGTQTAGGTLTISDVDTLDNPLSFA
ncbi:MAG: retention module-containing protein, partial [Sulfuritalea sp.]|nr:retention module-containing protein [Sulfuritalea sp.]